MEMPACSAAPNGTCTALSRTHISTPIILMKQSERSSIMRVLTDLIQADGIIDTREIECLESLRTKYGLRKDDEVQSVSYSLARALNELAQADEQLRRTLLSDVMSLTMSDNYCAREEALLLLAIRSCLDPALSARARVLSVRSAELGFEPSQMLYVESEYDAEANGQIGRCYRAISAEVRIAGFDFVYIPKVAEHYAHIAEGTLLGITGFLYPKVSEDRLKKVIRQLRELTTEAFCRQHLADKLGLRELGTVGPSLMVKVGDSIVDHEMVANFLLIELDGPVIDGVRAVTDRFAESYQNYRLNYLREAKGRFVFKGFYKQIFDILMLRKGIRSRVVVDTLHDRIYLPDADVAVERIHRREKALYALFLLESASGGINFNKPASPKQLERYKKRMEVLQRKYRMIYRLFGGDENAAPNLELSETRLPMLSLLKKQMLKLGGVLCQVDDYVIQRNFYGNYCVALEPELCCCTGEDGSYVPLAEHEMWKNISAL